MVEYGKPYQSPRGISTGVKAVVLTSVTSALVTGLFVYSCTSGTMNNSKSNKSLPSSLESANNSPHSDKADAVSAVSRVPIQAPQDKSFSPFSIRGQLTITSSSAVGGGADRRSGAFCQGVEGFGDIRQGTAVNVFNNGGTIISQGALSQGSFLGEGGISCVFTFEVPVKQGSDFYFVEISHRGRMAVDQGRARTELLRLSL
jgi:hypothetical protein